MEVHHKSHHPKKWKEYITEFLMLFFAVTLGFFAENFREHKVIEHKMTQNYIALVEDLKQDSIKIQEILTESEKYEINLVKFKFILFQYHKNEIGWDTLKLKYNQLGKLPSYNTLFINNTTFKNMQSSGLLSYIEFGELKSKLSEYYEVAFKRLEDNNKIFDESGTTFFNEQVPHRNSVEMNRGKEILLKQFPVKFSDIKNYSSYLLNLTLTKNILISEKLVYDLDSYSGRYYFYNDILHRIIKMNSELSRILKDIQH